VAQGEDFNTPELRDIVSELLSQFMSPEVSGFLTGPISKALQQYAGNSMALPGGGTVPLGVGSLFAGPVHIEHQVANQMVQQQITSNMGSAAEVASGVRLDIRNNLSEQLMGGPASTNLSMLNMASDLFLYGSLGLTDLQNNMQNAARYMGVAKPIAGGSQTVNNQFSNLAALMTADAAYNPGDFGGLRGGELGTLISEMSRTGSIRDLPGSPLSAKDISAFVRDPEGQGGDLTADMRARLQRTRDQVRGMSEIVGEFRRVFKTDVAGALDQINGLFGVDAASTFSPDRLTQLSNQIPSAGLATGFTTAQVVGLGAAAKQQANAAGFTDFTGGMSAGIMSAQLFRAAANENIAGFDPVTGASNAGNPFAFVDERRFRENMVKRVTGAQLSGLSRDVAGAAAIIEREGGDVQGFLSGLPTGSQFNSTDLARRAAEFSGADVSASDLRNASFSQEGRRFLEQGVGTNAVLQNNAAFIQDVRRQTLERVLSNRGLDINRFDFSGPLTSRSIRAALGSGNQDVADELDRTFSQNARAMGFQSVEGEDAFLNVLARNQKLNEIQKRTGRLTSIQEVIGSASDAVGGLRGLTQLVQRGGLEGADLGDVLTAVTGAEQVDVSEIADLVKFDAKDAPKGRARTIRQLALGTAFSTLFSGKFGDRNATEAQVEAARAIFESKDASPEERAKALKNFEAMVQESPALRSQMFEVDVADRVDAFKKANNIDPKKGITSQQSKALRQAEFLEQFETLDDMTLVKDSEEGDVKKRLMDLKSRYEKAAKSGEAVTLDDQDREALESARREAGINDSLAGVKKDATTTIVVVLKEILDEVRNANPKANNKK
jgi:hypothetical protein